MIRMLSTCILAGLASSAAADVVVFHNDNPDFDQVPYRSWNIPYYAVPNAIAMLDITRDSFAQPVTTDFPAHAVGFTAIDPPTSSSDSLGYIKVPDTTDVPRTAIVLDQEPVHFVTSSLPGVVRESIAPRLFNTGGVVGFDSNWGGTDSPYGIGLTLISLNPGLLLGPDQLVSLVGDQFTVAVRFTLDGAEHYGFAEFQIGFDSPTITYRPVRWGYEDEPGMPLIIPPSSECPADLALPFGVLNLSDVLAFLTAFQSSDTQADFEQPFGMFNFFDLSAYLSLYNAGCP